MSSILDDIVAWSKVRVLICLVPNFTRRFKVYPVYLRDSSQYKFSLTMASRRLSIQACNYFGAAGISISRCNLSSMISRFSSILPANNHASDQASQYGPTQLGWVFLTVHNPTTSCIQFYNYFSSTHLC